MRLDHWAVKEVYARSGLAAVRNWHRDPCIELPSIFNAPVDTEVLKTEPEDIPLLFPSAVYATGDRAVAFRVVTGPAEVITANIVGILRGMDAEAEVAWFERVTAAEEESGVGGIRLVDFFILSPTNEVENVAFLTAPGRRAIIGSKIPAGHTEESTANASQYLIDASLMNLTRYPDHHLVEVRKRRPKPMKASKQGKRPWLRDDLPHVILMDLAGAKRYGHRGEPEGTHASPIPHRRRGHWMTLRHERYGDNRGKRIWRRSAWIGDREWVFQGNTYRVMEEEIDE